MMGNESITARFKPFADGVLTARGTFQKYYSQGELRSFIEQSLGVAPIAVGPGLFYVFKDQLEEQLFLSERQRNRTHWRMLSQRERSVRPKVQRRALTERHKALLEDYWGLCLELGRAPAPQEFEHYEQLRAAFGSGRKAFELATEHFGAELLAEARDARIEDLSVYFALNLFGKRKPYVRMPDGLKRDLDEFFGSYSAALDEARELLFSVGRPDVIEAAAVRVAAAGLGRLDDDRHSLYVHSSLINRLPPSLRVYVGCAAQLYGDIETADLVKIHIQSAKLTLLNYDDFEGKAIPLLVERVKIKLREQDIDFFDYVGEYKPQPLYFKSRYLSHCFPGFGKQTSFDRKLAGLHIVEREFGPSQAEFEERLVQLGLRVRGFSFVRYK